jgi:hypothetical protein
MEKADISTLEKPGISILVLHACLTEFPLSDIAKIQLIFPAIGSERKTYLSAHLSAHLPRRPL